MLGLHEETLHQIYDNAPLPVHLLDNQGTLKWVNKEWLEAMGYESEEVIGQNYAAFVAPESRGKVQTYFELLFAQGFSRNEEIKLMRKDGAVLDITSNSNAVLQDGTFAYAHSILFDISKRKRIERELMKLSSTDYLTGNLNRRAILETIETEITRIDRYGGELSLLIVSINGLSEIISEYGHNVGDKCITATSAAIDKLKRTPDAVGRYEGNTFLIVLPETGVDGALVYGERLAYGLHVDAPDGTIVGLTLSIGISEFNENVMGLEDLIGRATSTQTKSKIQGQSTVSIYGT